VLQRILREAEGYLELNLPHRALESLARAADPGTFRGQHQYLVGEALRAQGRFQDALAPLIEAADLSPSNLSIWLALGWCQKRTGRLDLAIESLKRAREIEPKEALVHYNLACYFSLAGDKERCIASLETALALDNHYRDLIPDESDFDPVRSDPDFQALAGMQV
jgi:Flp pilus assembly protein TadD